MKIGISAIGSALTAVGGYAIGSAQSWWRRRTEHRRQLRLLLNELRRLDAYETAWPDPGAVLPDGAKLPLPPVVTPTFQPLVAAIDYQLTDELADDNSPLAFLTLPDGCRRLEEIYGIILDRLSKPGPLSGEDLEVVTAFVQEYNEVLRNFRRSLGSGLEDVHRRLREARTTAQIRRIYTRPAAQPGVNPPPIK